jgi:hypothetical protein
MSGGDKLLYPTAFGVVDPVSRIHLDVERAFPPLYLF